MSHLPTCEDATRLLVAYRAALAAFDRCAAFQSLAPEHITLQEAAQAREDAHVAVRRTRRAYWKHVDEHACRRLIAARPTSGIPGSISVHL
jgi:hypothetical protein